MASPIRRIVHIDMDAFYASVEQRDRPELKGKPIAVGGKPEGRGVVAAASYEARVFGVRSALSMAKAVRLCPSLVIIRPDFAKYRAVSKQVFDLFRTVTAAVEPLSLDEAYLDVTTNNWNEPLATTVAKKLKAQILRETNLTASAGVAPNKFLAKIASAWQKPDGLTVIAPERVETFLQKLPVEALWGVGPVTARKLRKIGIKRLVDLRSIGMTGKIADQLVSDIKITANKNTVPFDPESPFVTSGLRLGSAALTTRGFDEQAFEDVGNIIADRLLNPKDETIKVKSIKKVSELCNKFPLYSEKI